MGKSGGGGRRTASPWDHRAHGLSAAEEGRVFSPSGILVYMATADEETGGKWGVEWLFEDHPRLMKAEYVINEGGGVGMIVGRRMSTPARRRKGDLLAEIDLQGETRHASVPHSDNCVVKMAKAIERISAYRSPCAGTARQTCSSRESPKNSPFPARGSSASS